MDDHVKRSREHPCPPEAERERSDVAGSNARPLSPRRFRARRLLVASVGVATVNFAPACFGDDYGSFVANLMAPPIDVPTTAGTGGDPTNPTGSPPQAGTAASASGNGAAPPTAGAGAPQPDPSAADGGADDSKPAP